MVEITIRNALQTPFNVSKALKTLEEKSTIGETARIPSLDSHKLHELLLKNYRPPDVRQNPSGNVPICSLH